MFQNHPEDNNICRVNKKLEHIRGIPVYEHTSRFKINGPIAKMFNALCILSGYNDNDKELSINECIINMVNNVYGSHQQIDNYYSHFQIEDNISAMHQRKLFNGIIDECKEEINKHKDNIE